jgi:hypothetical protein
MIFLMKLMAYEKPRRKQRGFRGTKTRSKIE